MACREGRAGPGFVTHSIIDPPADDELLAELGHLITVRDGRTARLEVHRDWAEARSVAGLE